MATGEVVEFIVEYESAAVERDLAAQRARLPRRIDSDALLAVASLRYRQLKEAADRRARAAGLETLRDYSHLPMRLERVGSASALAALAGHPDVRAVYENALAQRVLAQSLPLTGQPPVAGVGYGGAGQTVAVIDDGIELANAAFGSCTAPGTPASCRIVASQTFVATPGSDNSHGTHVAAIVLGVAPQASIAALDVFSSSGALFSDVVSAINWAIANRSAYNIVAINMSLGDTGHNTTACSGGNTFATPVANARNAGISVVAAAGNLAYVSGAFTPGLAKPACTPGVLSVGAVYDTSVGGLTWGSSPNQCTDNPTQADQIACFSQSAGILSLLAPGALITAGGITYGGTSQASPHVAGAVAVLRAAFSGDTLSTSEGRLTSSTNSIAVTDPRNGITKPRLALALTARPANDDFASAVTLSGSSGNTSGTSLLATHESGEPVHAAAGAHSVWWRWTAPASGQVSLATSGSDFDTLLSVYTGNSVAALGAVAGNDNDTSTSAALRFQAQAGTTYSWAVDGAGDAAGTVALQWTLNTAAQANLAATLSGPVSTSEGSTVGYALGVVNAGPQAATGVQATLAWPSGFALAATPAGCTAGTGNVACSVTELASGAATSWTVQFTALALGSGLTLGATVTASTPDPVAADNSASLFVQVQSAGNGGFDTADVPALPPWGMVLLASLLAWGLQRSGRVHRLTRNMHPDQCRPRSRHWS